MAQSEMKNAPPLYGWAIAVAAGAVAFGVSLLLVGIEGNGSVFIGAVVALVVGIIFTIAETPPKPMAPRKAAPAPAPVAAPSAAVAPTTSAPSAAPVASAAAPAAAAPAAAAATESTDSAAASAGEGTKPEMLSGPVGAPDDLKVISGVGPVLEGKLNTLGVYHFWQIARWSDKEVAWVDGFLNFKGRIARDEWIKQATELAKSSPSKPPA